MCFALSNGHVGLWSLDSYVTGRYCDVTAHTHGATVISKTFRKLADVKAIARCPVVITLPIAISYNPNLVTPGVRVY